ncbi:MAG: N-acetyltransferase [Dehalococcoidia bacterium]
MSPVLIRPERPEDYDAVSTVTAAAFGRENEARLVEALRDSDAYVPELSLVAEEDGVVVGHTMLTYSTLRGGDADRRVLVLAPVSVTPSRQNDGIGGALCRRAIELADARGEPLISVLGHATYYPRFGFEVARPLGIDPPVPQITDASFMAIKLSHYDPAYRGRLIYPAPFAET